jgi:hypothetical protein
MIVAVGVARLPILVVRQRGLPQMQESAVDESLERCPAFNALHKRRRCQETDLDFFPKCLPAEGKNRCLRFLRNVGMFRRQLYR